MQNAEVVYTPVDADLDVQRAQYCLNGTIQLAQRQGQNFVNATDSHLPMCLKCPAKRGKVRGIRSCSGFAFTQTLLQMPVGEKLEAVPVAATLSLHNTAGRGSTTWPIEVPCAREVKQVIEVVSKSFAY